MKRKSPIRWGALTAVVAQVCNVLASPLVLDAVDKKTAAAIGIGVAIAQAVLMPVKRPPEARNT